MKRLPIAAASICSLAACTFGSPEYRTYNEAPGQQDALVTGTTCDSPTVAPDLGALTACGDGRGHCYDRTRVPAVGTLPSEGCAGGEVCVPDSILEAHGGSLRACTSIIGAGACVSTLVAEIAENAGALGRAECEADEVCAPCTDPTNGDAPTPFCLPEGIGVHEEACVTTSGSSSAPQKCCLSQSAKPVGVCISPNGIPEAQRDSVRQDLCKEGLACVPEALTRGEFTRCSAGYSGVCVDECFVGLTSSSLLLEGSCDDGQVCVPCLFGKGQGLPGCQGEAD